MNKLLTKIGWATLALVCIAFSIKTLKEPDFWWQLRTGEWILQSGAVPVSDPFSFTYFGHSWINIKWGFEVLIAFWCKLFPVETILLLQGVVSLLLLYTIYRTFKLYKVSNTIALISALLLVLCIEYRMIGRPEMFTHLFVALFLFIIVQYHQKKVAIAFLLIPLQILWANMHEAFGTGWAILIITSCGFWIDYFLIKGTSRKQAVNFSLISCSAIICCSFNPYGFTLLNKPLEIFNQVNENKFTTEMLGSSSYQYWKKEAYLGLFFLVLILLAWVTDLFHLARKQKKKIRLAHLFSLLSVPECLLLLAFAVLASTAYRNIALFAIAAIPLFAKSMDSLFAKQLLRFERILLLAAFLVSLSWYVCIVNNTYYEWNSRSDRYGLAVLSVNNPVGASMHISPKMIQGNIFSDYLTSSYLLWKLQPHFKTFIDLRDLDVFPTSFMDLFASAVTYPESFYKLDSQYRFKAVVLFRPQFENLHRALYNDTTYKLIFADAVACIYEKGSSTTEVVLWKQADPEISKTGSIINFAFNPFFKPWNENNQDMDEIAASYYISVGDENKGMNHLQRALKNAKEKTNTLNLLGMYYLNRSEQDSSRAGILLDSAEQYFKMSFVRGHSSASYSGLGTIYYKQQRIKEAIKFFELCLKDNQDNLAAHLYLGECYNILSQQNNSLTQKNITLALNHYLEAERLNPENPFVITNIGFLYYRAKDCDHAITYLEKIQNFDGLSTELKQQAKGCLENCR